MLIGDALITKEYWEPVFGELEVGFANKIHTQRGDLPIYTMRYKGMLAYVAAREHDDGVMEVFGWVLLVKPHSNWHCYEVEQSFVFPVARGEGWGTLLYDTIIQDDIILASGYQQSRTGRLMWKSMVKSDKYHIWAHDLKNVDRYAPVVYDEETDELWSPLKLYIDKPRSFKSMMVWDQCEDIRLIAIRKK